MGRGRQRRPRKWDNLHMQLAEQTAIVVVRDGRKRRTFHIVGYDGQAVCGISSAVWADRIRPDMRAKERQVCLRCIVKAKEFGLGHGNATDVANAVNKAMEEIVAGADRDLAGA